MKRKARLRQVPDAETLVTDPAYHLVKELPFQEMIPFVFDNIKKKGVIQAIYMGANILLAALILLLVLLEILEGSFSWKKLAGNLILGFFSGSVLVVPVHELVHGAAYRILGAKKIKFGADLKQFIFYVTADRYPVSGNQLYFLAMAPFVAINAAVLLVTIIFLPDLQMFFAFFLLSHNVMCIGDFAIVSFVRDTGGILYTFDAIEENMSYFYQRQNED